MLLAEWLKLVAHWEEVFSQERLFHRARRLALGLVVGLGLRTITRALGAVGREQKPWSSDYRVFSRSPWEVRALFVSIVEEALALRGEGPVVVAGDYTHLRRAGRKVAAAHWTRDPLSPPFHVNLVRAVRFFQLALIVPCAPGGAGRLCRESGAAQAGQEGGRSGVGGVSKGTEAPAGGGGGPRGDRGVAAVPR